MQIPSTMDRVQLSSPDRANEQIREETEANVRRFASADQHEITERLAELEREWDIERTLEANAGAIAFTGVLLAAAVDRRFLVIPGIVGAFLFQHAVQGWCPPVPLFRRLGIRTTKEIDDERIALKALRGDFGELDRQNSAGPADRADAALRAARR